MTTTPLFYVPAVPGTIRTLKKTHTGSVMPAVFKGSSDDLFIGVAVEDGDPIPLYGLTTSMAQEMEALQTLGKRTLRLMSAILARGNAVDAEIVRECWIASNLHPRVGADSERRENARNVLYHHLGQDVVKYLRDQERYAS